MERMQTPTRARHQVRDFQRLPKWRLLSPAAYTWPQSTSLPKHSKIMFAVLYYKHAITRANLHAAHRLRHVPSDGFRAQQKCCHTPSLPDLSALVPLQVTPPQTDQLFGHSAHLKAGGQDDMGPIRGERVRCLARF